MAIPFLYNADLLKYGVRVYQAIDLDRHPHLLCVGATGSGKTYALALLLGKIAKYTPTARLVVCDFKKGGFGWLDGCKGFFGFTDTIVGINTVYNELTVRLEANDPARNAQRIILLVDEYGALISWLEDDKKAVADIKKKIGNILFLGRSLGIHLIVGIQRADASYFHTGARDQFGAILMLGNLSKEQKLMLAPDYREEMGVICDRGQGYLLLDGQGLARVQVPTVNNTDRLRRVIADNVATTNLSAGAGEA